MANTFKFGNGQWATKEGSTLAYNDENGNFKPLPFTFDRASSATLVNKDGLIETVGADQPRVDYLNDSNGALLLEPSRSNLYLNSEPTTNEGASAEVTYESFSWSLGFSNCIKYGDNSVVRFRYGANVSASTEYTLSAFVIMDDLSEPVIGGETSENDFTFVIGGSVFNNANPNVNMGNNIYRVSVNGTTSASPNAPNNGILKFTSQSNKGFKVVGLQLEQGSYATSYIPTSGSAVTRVYDTIPSYLDITPLNIGNYYTLFLDANLNVNDNNKVFSTINNSSDVVSFTIRNNVGGIRLYNHIDANYPVSGITSATNKFVIRVDGNSYKVFVQGSSLSGTLTTQRDLGSLNFYGQNTELKINNFTIDNTALSDAECEALVN